MVSGVAAGRDTQSTPTRAGFPALSTILHIADITTPALRLGFLTLAAKPAEV
jgi:hypothetical protein